MGRFVRRIFAARMSLMKNPNPRQNLNVHRNQPKHQYRHMQKFRSTASVGGGAQIVIWPGPGLEGSVQFGVTHEWTKCVGGRNSVVVAISTRKVGVKRT